MLIIWASAAWTAAAEPTRDDFVPFQIIDTEQLRVAKLSFDGNLEEG